MGSLRGLPCLAQTMKIQILQSFGAFGGPALQPGDILEPPIDIALQWIRQGLAKPFGKTPETPSITPPEQTTILPSPKRKRKP